MHKLFAASPWWVLALIQRVPISFKFNCTSKKMLSLRQYEGAHVYHYMKDQSVSRRDSSQHFFFPPCHTYSVAVTSSAIKKKGSPTNNATLFIIMTGIRNFSLLKVCCGNVDKDSHSHITLL